MRRILFVVPLLLPLFVGCSMPWKKTHCGLTVIYHDPASVDTQTPVLINPLALGQQAHPVGAVAGPVVDGQFQHGVMQNGAPLAPQRIAPNVIGNAPCADNTGNGRLTCEEWCRLYGSVKARPLPPIQ